MKLLKQILYFLIVLIVYCLITVLNYFLGNFLIEIFTFDHGIKLMAIIFELCVLNPLVTYFITEKFPYEKRSQTKESVFLNE